MSFYAKKTPLGYKESGETDATHIIMTCDEYESLISEYKKMTSDIKKLKKYRKDSVQQVQRAVEMQGDIEHEMEEYKEKLQKAAVAEIKKYREQAEQEIKKAQELNWNLKRIMTERANADRKLKPKKEHPGYRLLNQDYIQYQFPDEGSRAPRRWCFRVTYETPYDAKLNRNSVQLLMYEDLEKIKKGTNIDTFFPGNLTMSMFSHFFEVKYCDEVCVLEYDIRANYRSGFYEVIFYTNYEVKFS